MLTSEQLLAVFPYAANAAELAPAIAEAWDRFGIASKNARAGFLGITGNETGGYRTIGREDMRYSADRALELFPRAQAHPDVCRDRCSTVAQDRGKRFASWIYADLYGNGPESTGDGWAFRGGGMIQLTFKSTYAACAEAIGVDIVADPNLIATPKVAALSAAWFVSTYKPQILPLLDMDGETAFLQGAAMVGWSDTAATQRRLDYRRHALDVVDGGAPVDLRAVQAALLAAGCDPKGVDGLMGRNTRTALSMFQSAHGLPVTGQADAATCTALGLAA